MVGAVAQRVKEAEITEQDSLLLTRNLLRIAIFNISYIRGLFPEKYFNDKSIPALDMKIKKLMPMDDESRRLIDWMEKGVYDALQKKFLKTLVFCICEEVGGSMIEEYAFSFSYSSSNNEEVCMNVSRNGSKKNGATFKSNTADVTPDQMRSAACKMVRTLVSLMRTLDQMPEQRTILMKLFYYEDVTPDDYEPPFFQRCPESESHNIWNKNPLKMEVGNVNSKHIVLALKVKSVLDPCDDENMDLAEDEDVSLGGDSVQGNDSSDSEVHPSHADRYIVAPTGKNNQVEDTEMASDAETQDTAHEDEQTTRVREWINSRHVANLDLADILSNFPDISMVVTEAIADRLVNEGLLSRAGKDSYVINKEFDPKISDVKEEVEMNDILDTEKTCKNIDEDHLYMKALYHALPMEYVTISKLQSKLEGEANQSTVRKLIDKMAQDGYVKSTSNRRLGKRVIHSEYSNRKLLEVKKFLEFKPMETEANGQPFDFTGADIPPNDVNMQEGGSTVGGFYSIGSDLTRTRERSEQCQNDQGAQANAQEYGNTASSKLLPVSSLESGVNAIRRLPRTGDDSTPDKQSRKASMVKEPILQHVKRQKSVQYSVL